MDLKGKVALITGGGRGLGKAIAQRFIKEGAKVVISGRNKATLDKAVKALPKGSALACPGDVTSEADVKRMVAKTVKFGGKIDVLVNNAAYDYKAAVAELPPEEWRKVIETNLTAPFMLMKEALPHMIKAKSGSIINIASLGGTRCLPICPAYCTSKAGLIMLSQQAALDYGKYNIRVNAVCPGGIDTDLLDEMVLSMAKKLKKTKQETLDYFSRNVPLRRVSKPEEITGLCVYLASGESTFMTGSALLIDGGCAIVDVAGTAFSSTL